MILLIKLFLAHLIGDFFIQPKKWVAAKENKKLAAYQLYLHIIIHWILLILIVWDWNFFWWAGLLAGLHLVIDTIKLYFQTKKIKRGFFFFDQLLHLASIYVIWLLYTGDTISLNFAQNEKVLLLITLILFLTFPSAILIKNLIEKWQPSIGDDDDNSLQNAGKYIGILERLFVFLFVISNHWEAIGFLIAAKSIFRFGDIKDSKDRKLTEYFLIGTLVSFGIAILTGVIFNSLQNFNS